MKILIPLILFFLFYRSLPAQFSCACLGQSEATSPSSKTQYIYAGVKQAPTPGLTKAITIAGTNLTVNEYFIQKLVYPESARLYGVEGIVKISIVVTKEGRVGNAVVFQSAHPVLDQAVLELARSLPLLDPARIEGEPLQTTLIIPVQFGLK